MINALLKTENQKRKLALRFCTNVTESIFRDKTFVL